MNDLYTSHPLGAFLSGRPHLTLYLVYLDLENNNKNISPFASRSYIYTVEGCRKSHLGFIFFFGLETGPEVSNKIAQFTPPPPLRGECPPWGKL